MVAVDSKNTRKTLRLCRQRPPRLPFPSCGMSRSASSRRAGHPDGRHDDDTATSHRFRYRQRVWDGRSKHRACFGDGLQQSEHRSARTPRRRQARPSRLTGDDAAGHQRSPLPPGRAGTASTMYPLGLDRLASTGSSLTGSDSLGPSGPPVSRPCWTVGRCIVLIPRALASSEGLMRSCG